MHVYVTLHVFECYAMSTAVLMFELDNEKQHIFTFCAFMNQNLHQYAGKTFDRITTSVIIITPLTTLPRVLLHSQ